MDDKKINMLIEILKDMPLSQWNQIKNKIEIAYRDIEYKKVPNSQLETLKTELLNVKDVGLIFLSNSEN